MYLEIFNEDRYTEEVGRWLIARAQKPPLENEFPAIGYMAFERGEPIAVAFLRNVEGGLAAHLDGLATNPDAPSDMRSEAIDLVVEKIMDTAKKCHYKAVFAYSVDTGTIMRSKKFGFRVLPHVLIVSNLEDKA